MPESTLALPDSGTEAALAPIDAKIVARGIARLFGRNDIWCLPEMPLRNGRRADLMGVDAKGQIIIVEIKTSRADLLGDNKWTDYLDYCDRFYWGLSANVGLAPLDQEAFLPDRCGVIVADSYDAEIIRPARSHTMAAARRKTEMERLARASIRRQVVASDPECSAWAQ